VSGNYHFEKHLLNIIRKLRIQYHIKTKNENIFLVSAPGGVTALKKMGESAHPAMNCRKGHPKIARQFIAGKRGRIINFSPVGTAEVVHAHLYH